MSTTTERLLSLGDPSGKQTASYWNEWFDIVCPSSSSSSSGDEERTSSPPSFEWYCDANEVSRVVKARLAVDDENDRTCAANSSRSRDRRFLHPGSGNSRVPFHLSRTFPGSRHVILDVSDVALAHVRDAVVSTSDDATVRVRCEVANVLEPPINISSSSDESSFDVWIDKGLLDALFSGASDDERQCRDLFDEAHRLLRSDEKRAREEMNSAGDETTAAPGGLLVVVSMAEEHSLRLILQNWLREHENSTGERVPMWKETLYVHELRPSSGSMRPFAFVLEKLTASSIVERERRIEFHPVDDDSEKKEEDKVERVGVPTEKGRPTLESCETVVNGLLNPSRERFLASCRAQTTPRRGTAGRSDKPQILGTIEISPSSDESDLDRVCARVTAISTTTTGTTTSSSKTDADGAVVRWYPSDETSLERVGVVVANDDAARKYERVGEYGELMPIGFGICKLILRCVVESYGDLEHLCELIQESEENEVQSVEIRGTLYVGPN